MDTFWWIFGSGVSMSAIALIGSVTLLLEETTLRVDPGGSGMIVSERLTARGDLELVRYRDQRFHVHRLPRTRSRDGA